MHKIDDLSNNKNGDYMEIKDVMSKNLVIGKNTDSIKKISELMKEHDIGFVPICKGQKIIGVITDRDIVVRALTTCAKCSSKIESYISPNVISCNIDDSIDTVLKVMKESKIKRVLITELEKIVGIVSISDIINEKNAFETFKEIYAINRNSDYFKTEIDEFYL